MHKQRLLHAVSCPLSLRPILWAILLISFQTKAAEAESLPPQTSPELVVAPYLRADAPVFGTNLTEFREKHNQRYPQYMLSEYRSIKSTVSKPTVTRAAVRINDTLYSSVALEKGTTKIRSLQLTYLPNTDIDAKLELGNKNIAINYMAAVVNSFDPTLSFEKSQQKVRALLEVGKGSPFYQQTSGAFRFVISDHGKKGVTLAIEPIKLSLSEP